MRNGRGLGEAREGSLDCNPKCFLYMRKGDDRCGLLFGLGIEPLFMEAASANVFFGGGGFNMSIFESTGFLKAVTLICLPP